MTKECDACLWPKLAEAYKELLAARRIKDGRKQAKLRKQIDELEQQNKERYGLH